MACKEGFSAPLTVNDDAVLAYRLIRVPTSCSCSVTINPVRIGIWLCKLSMKRWPVRSQVAGIRDLVGAIRRPRVVKRIKDPKCLDFVGWKCLGNAALWKGVSLFSLDYMQLERNSTLCISELQD